MSIPDFQSIILPLLEYLADGEERSNQEIFEALEKQFCMTEEEKSELLPSGKQKVFINRVGWAKSFLRQASLIESARRGYYSITEAGKDVLSGDHPDRLDVSYLMRLPSFLASKQNKNSGGLKDIPAVRHAADGQSMMTPEEHIEFGINSIRQQLTQDLIDNILKCSFYFFEKLVVDLLLSMGYGGSRQEAGILTSKGSDEGIDGVINEDKLGLDVIYVQAKRWKGNVSRPEIQKFAGALQGRRAKKGIYITTSDFTKEAFEYAASIESKIILIDGERLAELMIEYGVGVSIVQSLQLKKVDVDYFIEY